MNYISNMEMFTVFIVRSRGIIQDNTSFFPAFHLYEKKYHF